MATLEKPKQKKNKHVPSKSSKSKISKDTERQKLSEEVLVERNNEIADTASCSGAQQSEQTSECDVAKDTENETFESLLQEAICDEEIRDVEHEDVKSFTVKGENDKDNERNEENNTTCDIKSDVTLTKNTKVLSSAPLTISSVSYPKLPTEEKTEHVKIETKLETIKPFTISQLAALYNNPELGASKQFVSQFVDSELGGVNSSQHPLYELLINYLQAREKLQENSIELNQLKNEYISCQYQMWILDSATVSKKGQCQDGNNLTVSHEYKIAKYQTSSVDTLLRLQNKIKLLANETYTLHAYTTSLLKIKIDHYISTVLHDCQETLNVSLTRVDIPAILQNELTDSSAQRCLRELRLCVSVLFAFQRRLCKDRDFVSETRAWLKDTVALLLRVADWHDHHYLLNQVLRSPAGVGSWAAEFIQVPIPEQVTDAPFSDRYINHIVAVLSVLLCPVEKRDAFLEQILTNLQDPHDVVSENIWVLVDSDGEEDEDNNYGVSALKENDLVALLNQIPITDLFRNILLIHRQDGRDIWVGGGDAHHVLRLFSFCTVFVQLFEQGLATYNSQRYHQFAKRLCRLIRHTLQYTSDLWEAYRVMPNSHQDLAMFERLQIEFDAFFLRATASLYRAQKLGAWQFLAIAPFQTVSIGTLWRFFYMIHQGTDYEDDVQNLQSAADFKSKLIELSARQQFSERLSIMSVEESYYLLNTFANMILARSAIDEEFIQFATLNLLQIGFSLETESQESCCKCAAILLSNITSRYPALISDILSFVKNNITELNQTIFLFSELPLHLWHPKEKDVDNIAVWLLQNPITSVESCVARKILSNLNWNFSSLNDLFLPLSLHRRTALLILETVDRYAATADNSGFLDGVKQAVGQQQSSEQHLIKWAWHLVYQLRLHATSRQTTSVKEIPELVELDVVQRCCREKQPLGCYLALTMSSVGHLLPLVCSQGLTLLETLAACYKHDAILISLHDIIPLFLNCTETLLMCTSFQNIIANLLNADKTYMKMAKSLIAVEFPGTILRQFANMINTHIHNPHWHVLMDFWTKTLISVTNWNKDPGILYLLNVIVRAAFFIPEKFRGVADIFKELLEKATDRNNGSNSSLLSWMPLVSSNSPGSALLLGSNSSCETWLAYLVISLEHQHVELQTGLWAELLRQLYAISGKTNVDTALKKAANIVKVPAYTSNGLCFYRWAQLALDTPMDHPLLALIWQKFFSLYLARVPPEPRAENRGSVGSKFFDGIVNTSFCKKLKKRLQETVEFYKNKIEASKELESDLNPINNKEFDERCIKMFSAYILWLEEPLLQEPTLYLPSLPPQYEPRYLAHIIQGSTSPWVELVNCEYVRNDFEKSQKEWDILTKKSLKLSRWTPLQSTRKGEELDPVERILRRLTSYDKPLPPPPLKQISFNIPVISFSAADSVASTLQPYIKKLQQFAEIYILQVSEHGALECQYKELMKELYGSFQTKITYKKTCKPTCSGVAVITLTFCEARVNESIKLQMQTNRTNFSTLLSRTLQLPVQSMCVNCASIEYSIECLQTHLFNALRQGDSATDAQIRKIGVEFFYHLLFAFNEDLKNYPPTHQLFNSCLEKLGQIFLRGIECETVRLVKTILQQPNKGNFLTPHFVAVDLSTNVLLQLYSDICDKVDQMPEITFTLLSKFNIQSWLSNKRPRLVDRTKLIQILFESLTRLGPTPSKQQYTLHEVFRRHLLTVFRYEFPEHYGEILMQVLQHSSAQTLAVSVWMDLLNALSSTSGNVLPLKEQLRTHATRQKMLTARDLSETVSLLSRYFVQERLQFGLYGLYPKYRIYIDPISLLLGMTIHALVVALMEQHVDLLADVILDKHLWPCIIDAFAPWLQPYSVNDCKDATAAWIQQLADDRSVLLPWIQADIASAKKVFDVFVCCVEFVGDTLPACTNLLSYVWKFYSTNFAHPTIKEHIWTVVHESLSGLDWEKFWPSLPDLEMMLKVVEQYLPQCHIFLGRVFLEVNWPLWLAHLAQSGNVSSVTRAHHCLLHLLVKMSREPSVRQADRTRNLLERAREFAWSLLDISALEHVLDWYVMSCDPRVALPADPAIKQIDYIVLGLLKTASCYDCTTEIVIDATIIKKRQCFIRAYIKMLVNCASRHKNVLASKSECFHLALTNQLNSLEQILTVDRDETLNQSDLLVSEFLTVLNNSCLSIPALKSIDQWLQTSSASSPILRSVLRTATSAILSSDSSGTLLETALSSYFTIILSEEPPTWKNVSELLKINGPRLEQSLIISGNILTLNALLLQKISLCKDRSNVETLLEAVVGWLAALKANDLSESKLPLLWVQVIRLSLRLCHEGDEVKAATCLKKFVNGHLLPVAENKTGGSSGGWGRGILGAIGLSRQGAVSPQCRFLCRATAGYILAQMPELRKEPQKVRCFSGASGPVGQPGGNAECAKILLKFDAGISDLKPHIEYALKEIQNPQNSLHNAESFLISLVDILYSKAYLKMY